MPDPKFKSSLSAALDQGRKSRGPGLTAAAVIFAFGLNLSACAPTENFWGYIPDEKTVSRLKTGSDNRRKVARLLGSPSSVSTFESDTWYYISKRTSTVAFFDPKVLDQRILAVDFDDNGVVKEIRRFTLEDARNIQLVERKTVTRGRELGLLEQLFGNIGRFNSSSPGLDASKPGL